ncbi:MAG: hypothetical protein MHM6MM_006931 [Cercozoa sp. M6MM]
MGRVRNKLVKSAARDIVCKYYNKLTYDFHTNKKIIDEIAIVPSKRVRNQIAGYVTHLMKRLNRGAVKGIVLKVQQEANERRLDYVPVQSAIQTDKILVDEATAGMLADIGFDAMPNLEVDKQ